MAILVSCECGMQYREFDACAGRQARCPGCGRVLNVPGAIPPGDDGIVWSQPGPASSTSSGKAIASVLLGIASLPCLFMIVPGFVCGILAIQLGLSARGQIESGKGRFWGRGMARAGIAMGGISCVLTIILILCIFLDPNFGHRESARRSQCMNNLKQIGLALHNYHENWTSFPPSAITDPAGKPLLSWRVAILPYMEQDLLHSEFHLDEPWDSPHNLTLLARRPAVYACPSDRDLPPTTTRYLGLVGPGAFFEGTEGLKFISFLDGIANTLAVVESKKAVPWTRPDDLAYSPAGPLPVVGSQHRGGFNALFADGSVRFIKDAISPESLRSIITRNGCLDQRDDQSY